MIRAHRKAVQAMITGLPVYVSVVPDAAVMPYVVLHPDQGVPQRTSMSGDSDWRSWRYVTHCFGSDAEQAGWAAERVEAGLLDKTPTVAGRVCDRIIRESSQPIQDDNATPTNVVYLARDVWLFHSIPA